MVSTRSLVAQEQQRLVEDSLETAKKLFEGDTETSLAQLNNIRQKNTSTTIGLIKKEEQLKLIAQKFDKIQETNDEVNRLVSQLDELEPRVELLEEISKELDEYSQELEVKVISSFK